MGKHSAAEGGEDGEGAIQDQVVRGGHAGGGGGRSPHPITTRNVAACAETATIYVSIHPSSCRTALLSTPCSFMLTQRDYLPHALFQRLVQGVGNRHGRHTGYARPFQARHSRQLSARPPRGDLGDGGSLRRRGEWASGARKEAQGSYEAHRTSAWHKSTSRALFALQGISLYRCSPFLSFVPPT